MKPFRIAAALIIALGISTSAPAVSGQDYPSKPVRLVTTGGPGSSGDIISRAVAQKLSVIWGQPVIVENRVGAGGGIGAGHVLTEQADGHTLLINSSAQAISVALHSNLPYDTLKDFIDVTPIAKQPSVLVTGTTTGIKSVADLVALAKSKPGELNYGSAGLGGATHFSAEKLRLAADIDAVHIPYLSASAANLDAAAGRITYWLSPISAALSLVQDGRLRVLGVSTAQRSSIFPDVPTIAEAGIPGYDFSLWFGLWAKRGTPDSIVSKIQADVATALLDPALHEQFRTLGSEPMSMTSAQFAAFMRSEVNEATRIVKEANIKVD